MKRQLARVPPRGNHPSLGQRLDTRFALEPDVAGIHEHETLAGRRRRGWKKEAGRAVDRVLQAGVERHRVGTVAGEDFVNESRG